MAKQAMPLVERLQAQARKVLEAVQRQIRDRESELESLREQTSRWLAAIGSEAPKRRGRPAGSGTAAKTTAATRTTKKKTSPPVDWDKVLGRLPKSFTMKELERATPALKEHRQARNIALARWSRSKAIKKTGDGKYQKVGKTTA